MINWVVVAHGDVGIKSLPDKHTSVGGHVIMICNKVSNKCCITSWKSKNIKRKVGSSTAGEALATLETIGEVVYLKAVLEKIFGSRVKNIPVVVLTDSQNLHRAIYSTSLVEDAWSVTEIAAIKDALDDGVVQIVKQVEGSHMLANALTKKGAGAKELMQVLKSGEYVLPDGWNYVE